VYTNTTIYFEAHATADTDGKTSNWEYGYKVELHWRVGMNAVAAIYLYGSWKSGEFEAVAWQNIPIYGPIVVKSGPSISARDTNSTSPWELSEDPLPNALFGVKDLTSLYELSSAEDSIMVSANLYNHTDLDLPPFSNLSVRTLEGLGHAVHSLHSRADGSEKEFMLGDFKCTTGSSPCSANLPNTFKFRPRGHGHHSSINHGHGLAVRSIPELQKRAATDCPGQLPRLYYNCAPISFANVNLQGPSGTVAIPGICSSVRRYLTAHGINTDQYPLHWDPSYSPDRRKETCSEARSPCSGTSGENARYKAATGINAALVSCDEFPFASSEEGGWGWQSALGDNALPRLTTQRAPRLNEPLLLVNLQTL
jgi:hypothetical protein